MLKSLIAPDLAQGIINNRATMFSVPVKAKHGFFIPDGSDWPVDEGTDDWMKDPYPVGCIVYLKRTWARYPSMEFIFKDQGAELCKSSMPTNRYQNKWQSPATMPREAARIFIEITAVKVQRVQDVSDEEAVQHGVEQWPDGNYKVYGKYPGKHTHARGSFRTLWQSQHGNESWEANAFLFTYTFRVLSTTGKPENVEI